MPYVKPFLREKIDDSIEQLIEKCVNDEDIVNSIDGVANYIITRIVMSLFKPDNGWNYSTLSNVVKTLECAKLEAYRQMVGPYEETCIAKNGNLNEYLTLWKDKLDDKQLREFCPRLSDEEYDEKIRKLLEEIDKVLEEIDDE